MNFINCMNFEAAATNRATQIEHRTLKWLIQKIQTNIQAALYTTRDDLRL